MIEKMSNIITNKKFLLLYFLLVPIVIFLCGLGKTRIPHDIYAVSFSNQAPEVYLGSFYSHNKWSRLRFDNGVYEKFRGKLIIKRQKDELRPPLTYPLDKTKSFQLFFLQPDDQVCIDKTCNPVTEKKTLGVISDGENGSISSTVARIAAWKIPNFEPFYIHSEQTTNIVLADVTMVQVRQLSLFNNNRFSVDFYKNTLDYLPSNQIMLLFSSIVSSLFIYCLIFILMKYYNKLNLFDVFILILISIEYLNLFPGIFTDDVIFQEIPSSGFSIHYSSIFMIYNYVLYMVDIKLIQLPIVICISMTFIILAHSIRQKAIRYIFYYLILFVILVCPIYYAMAFVSQRYFIPPILTILSIYFFLKSISVKEGDKINATISVVLVTIVVLLRKEYIIIPLLYIAVLFYYRKVITSKTKKRYFLGGLFFVLSIVLVNHVVPPLFHVDVAYHNRRLEMISLMDMVRPYVPCPGSEAERKPTKASVLLVHAIDLTGSTKAYCDSPTSEVYFWGPANGTWMRPDDQKKAAKKFKKGLVLSIFEQPMPSLLRFKDRAIGILNKDVWQLSDKYKIRGLSDLGSHIAIADNYNLIVDKPMVRPMEQFLIKMANMLNADINYWNWLSAFILLFVYPVLFYRLRAVFILNFAIIILACGSIFLSPTVNWTYILMVPVWVFFAIPLALMEKDWLKSLEEKRDSIVA
ncbi:hypothetical protein [Bartonella apis]|uniref:hypothetical protein n=1 Tax=Bartonella apis TaxID=1686310 RepID=UPI003BB5DDDF